MRLGAVFYEKPVLFTVLFIAACIFEIFLTLRSVLKKVFSSAKDFRVTPAD